MKITILVFVICVASVLSKSVKKSAEDTPTAIGKQPKYEKPNNQLTKTKVSKSKLKAPPLPIIAIEIVDPNEKNTTKSKNSKRTIGSSLGYGFQPSNSFGVTNKPRLVYFKYTDNIPGYQTHEYSQENLQPPPPQYQYTQQQQQQQQYQQSYIPPQKDLDIQKSVSYDLGTKRYIEYNKPTQQQQQQYYQPGTTLFTTFNQQGQIGGLTSQLPQQQNAPVILLKVYSDQLGNPIYPNLPESHPYAGLNNINLQGLLSKYVYQNYQQGGQGGQKYTQQQYSQQGDQQTYNQQDYYQQPQQEYYQDKNYQQDYYLNQPNQYHQQYQDDIHQQQYQGDIQQQPYQGGIQQQQYQQYQQQPHHIENVYHKPQYKGPSLPTEENYPDEAHTRVIFYSNTGHIANPETTKQVYKQPVQQEQQDYPETQSYSTLQYTNQYQPKQQEEQQQQQQQDYDLPQTQDNQGYYYYKPEDFQNYQAEQPKEEYPQSPAGTITETGELDTQKVKTPHNYHAHPVQNSKKRRTVRRPASVKKIPKITKDDDEI